MKDGKIKPGEEYRVVLVGTSWGADKAIEVAQLLGELLADDEGTLGDLYFQDKIQIHLITIDAIAQRHGGKLGNEASTREIQGKAKVASWHNYYQTDDTGYVLMDPLFGQRDFKGAVDSEIDFRGKKLNLPFATEQKNGHHVGAAKAALQAIRTDLYAP